MIYRLYNQVGYKYSDRFRVEARNSLEAYDEMVRRYIKRWPDSTVKQISPHKFLSGPNNRPRYIIPEGASIADYRDAEK